MAVLIAIVGWPFAFLLWRALNKPPRLPRLDEYTPDSPHIRITVTREIAPTPRPVERKTVEAIAPISPNLKTHEGMSLAAIIDVETTGFSNSDEIIELAVALIAYHPETFEIRGIVDSYAGNRQPGCQINPFAARVHGISEDSLVGRTINRIRVCEIVERSGFLVAHNAAFDKRFMRELFPEIQKPWLCTMSGIDWEDRVSRRMVDLMEEFQISTVGHHGAASDVASLLELLGRVNAQNVTYFHELVTGGADKIQHQRKNNSKARSKTKAASR